jgi:hypothetical protein
MPITRSQAVLDRKTIRLFRPVVSPKEKDKIQGGSDGNRGDDGDGSEMSQRRNEPEKEEQGGVSSVQMYGWQPQTGQYAQQPSLNKRGESICTVKSPETITFTYSSID